MIQEYWISPDGEIVPIEQHPIRSILTQPKRFGFTLEMMEIIYAKFSDDNQEEGEATKTIIRDLINKGWAYCFRHNPEKDWRVEVQRLDKKTRFNLRLWGLYMLKNELLHIESHLKIYRYSKNIKIKKTLLQLLDDNLF